ncbi:beta-lactamase [Haliscomenobacter hydrossis DSM 1100]|uniref:Beta-lactamase n=2 Tax=Haliscomenobacter TaxID=2349 RepID=F4KS11_HALH1|nr:beta-lactamase [Haliscomenobacter hydrossis DSM 1100]
MRSDQAMYPMKKTFVLFILLLLYGLLQAQSPAATIDPLQVQKLIRFCDSSKADEIMLLHRDKVVLNWRNPHCDSLYMGTASMIKSWTGLVLGILIDRKLIKSVEDKVCTYLPEWKEGCTKNVTIQHLVSMSAGLNRKGARGVLSKTSMNKYVLGLTLDTLPDVRFNYSNESVQLLGLVIEKVSKKPLDRVFADLLFKPLGMDSTRMSRDSAGNALAFGGGITTLQDAAQVGLLMHNMGQYRGRQIVSEQWVKASITPSKRAPYYGYLWWLDNTSKHKNYAATGDLGQMTIVFPELDLIFLRRQNCDLSPASLSMRWMGPQFLELIANTLSPNNKP